MNTLRRYRASKRKKEGRERRGKKRERLRVGEHQLWEEALCNQLSAASF
jgi:hypothetical protein